MLYVVAGDGAQKIGSTEMNLPPARSRSIPRGTPHIITHRGGRSMLVLSILTGPALR